MEGHMGSQMEGNPQYEAQGETYGESNGGEHTTEGNMERIRTALGV